MRIGVPKEIKIAERRVAMTPNGVSDAVTAGHVVLIQRGAGVGSGFADSDYEAAGAALIDSAAEIFGMAEMIVKVKEPLRDEAEMLRAGQILFSYLHLAADPELARALGESGAICVAYETVEDGFGRLPLLTPMSEIAGRLAAQAAAQCLLSPAGGRGVLMGGVPGTPPARGLVIGAGVAGTNAALVAAGMRAEVCVFDIDAHRLREAEALLGGRVTTRISSPAAIASLLPGVDFVIGAVLVPGARAPVVISREQLATMKAGAVLVDVSVDQGGCFETTRPTTHESPTYVVDGVCHHCVANIPAAAPITSTIALTNATLPYVLRIASLGLEEAARQDAGLVLGINVVGDRITHPALAASLGAPCVDGLKALRLAGPSMSIAS